MDNLYEPSKKAGAIAITLLFAAEAAIVFVGGAHSKFIEPAIRGPFDLVASRIMLFFAFVFAAAFSAVNIGTVRRGKKILELRKSVGEGLESSDRRAFYETRDNQRKLKKTHKKHKCLLITQIVFGSVSLLLFIAYIAMANGSYLYDVLSKPPIDRAGTDGDFRMWTDFLLAIAFIITMASYFAVSPFTLRNIDFPKYVLYPSLLFGVLSTIHYCAYFFAYFTNYPSFHDFILAAVCLIIVQFDVLNLITAKKKKTISGFNGKQINIYEF